MPTTPKIKSAGEEAEPQRRQESSPHALLHHAAGDLRGEVGFPWEDRINLQIYPLLTSPDS